MSEQYDHRHVEKKWQQRWAEEKTYNVNLEQAEKPFYNLMMFPYPSAEGLHVGNFFAFTGSDIFGRFKKAQGYDVFEPMGFDAFGIHSENYALQVGAHPWKLIPRNIKRFKDEQLTKMGAMFDWDHEVNTTDPEYYKWTQWIFLQLYKNGLAYRKEGLLNWCSSCKTVLSDEQVAEGVCERCNTPVSKKMLAQWYLRITKYAQQLLDNLDWIDWSERTKDAQRRWIGRSTGAEIAFQLEGYQEALTVYTTRPDTLFGVTYMVLAPEHPQLKVITTKEQQADVDNYVEEALRRSEIEREGAREKTGVFTGAFAINPLSGSRVPIWVSDYVLMTYGSGAIMAVPAHDTRDFEFAVKFGLPVIEVISPDGQSHKLEEAYTGEGVLVNSGRFNGMPSTEAIEKVTAYCEERGIGQKSVKYRLRDWGISRQRYWGPPVPVIHCERCGVVPVPEEDLPVRLPYTENFKPLGTGQSPLATVPEFIDVACPKCSGPAKRDSDVMDNFLDSSWYFFRYPSARDQQQVFDKTLVKKWLPVDMYIGGNEHAVLHLMYTRFITMALHDMGLIDFKEPFKKFRAHGLLIKEGAKMSKSKGNVINPDNYIEEYGADTLRTYLVFLGPYTEGGDFRDLGITGIRRFLEKVWRLFTETPISTEPLSTREELQLVHRTIRKVTTDIERLAYNTAVASLMEFTNGLLKLDVVKKEALDVLLKLLQPFAPHITHELYEKSGGEGLLTDAGWPAWNEEYCRAEEVEFVFLVNGKPRGRAMLSIEATEEDAWEEARKLDTVMKYVADKQVKKRVFVPERLLNIIV